MTVLQATVSHSLAGSGLRALAYSAFSICQHTTMLARLLRRLYLFQMLTGALLGTYAGLDCLHTSGGLAMLLGALCAMLLPLLLQFGVIAYTMLKSRPANADVLWWHAFWGEFLAALQIYWFQLPWAQSDPATKPALTAAPAMPGLPVLLVHGYICNHRVWDKMAQALQQAGHPVLAIDLEPLFTSIDDYAPLIEQAVQRLQQQTGEQKIALLGHSMGGLAIRAWIRANGTKRAAQVITLGTPHQGTRIASFALTPNVAQMAWHSEWLQALQAQEVPTVRKLLHIALTVHDNIVFDQRAQVLDGATLTEFTGLGHLQLCLDESVIAWVLQQLRSQHD